MLHFSFNLYSASAFPKTHYKYIQNTALSSLEERKKFRFVMILGRVNGDRIIIFEETIAHINFGNTSFDSVLVTPYMYLL